MRSFGCVQGDRFVWQAFTQGNDTFSSKAFR
ncbi:hypothetical protein U062_00045 [Gammaproteobacteria bacterium MOLA455]|nr:hypothetical protein U062_00045 [Gammaproteobacteria bacterium MOLA455]